MLTFGSELQKKCKINYFCRFQSCHCSLVALMEYTVVADYSAEANPNVANLHRGKTRQGASDVASRSLGQVEAYLTVRETWPRRARAQMACAGVSLAVLAGSGMER